MTSSTPEATAAHESFSSVQRSNRQLLKIVLAGIAVVVLIAVATCVFVATETASIRSTQLGNTKVSRCQDKALNDALKDAHLAISGDKNAADYAVPPKC